MKSTELRIGNLIKFEHVHQLQNFYFAQTNKELELI